MIRRVWILDEVTDGLDPNPEARGADGSHRRHGPEKGRFGHLDAYPRGQSMPAVNTCHHHPPPGRGRGRGTPSGASRSSRHHQCRCGFALAVHGERRRANALERLERCRAVERHRGRRGPGAVMIVGAGTPAHDHRPDGHPRAVRHALGRWWTLCASRRVPGFDGTSSAPSPSQSVGSRDPMAQPFRSSFAASREATSPRRLA